MIWSDSHPQADLFQHIEITTEKEKKVLAVETLL